MIGSESLDASCAGKTRYANPAEATKPRQRMMRNGGRVDLYRCRHCDG